MQSFLPADNDVALRAMESTAFLSQGSCVQLSKSEHPLVLVRSDVESLKTRGQVALLSGGGSGHEPAMAGLVGRGLLSCAVAGRVFASPPYDDVLAGIRACGSSGGVLVVCMQYTGDVVNFTAAVEDARREYGLKVGMVVVDDDASGAAPRMRRGLAGTLLIHKLAGAAAELGWDLDGVVGVAKDALPRLATVNMGFGHCTLPGKAGKPAMDAGTCEFGLGIHGEPGAETLASPDARGAAHLLVGKLVDAVSLVEGQACCLVLNNLGTMSQLDMLVFASHAREELRRRGVEVARVYSGTLMTALDTRGLSVTVLACPSANELSLLDFPVDCLGWAPRPPSAPNAPVQLAPRLANSPKRARAAGLLPAVAARRLEAVLEALAQAADKLDGLDAKCGDGDCGTTVAASVQRLRAALSAAEDYVPGDDVLRAAESACAGGSLGGIFRAVFAKARDGAAATWLQALQRGIEAAKEAGGADVGARSFLDALIPASRATTLKEAAVLARSGANATRSMVATVGRAAHVPVDKYAGFVDPGAEAVAVFFEALSASS